MAKRTRLLIALMAMVLVVAACGGDDDAAPSDTQQIASNASSFKFDPATWTVAAGQDVTLTLTNASDAEHEWVIMKAPIASEADFTEDGVYWEMEAEPGESKSDTFTPPAPGTYQIVCAIDGHFTAGMVGELVVTG